jgi:hypothetical protein
MNARRQFLIDTIDRYLDSLVKNSPAGLPVTENVRFTENGHEIKLGEGLWETATGITYRQYFVDPAGDQVGFFGVADENGQLAHLMLRLKVVDNKISEVETIVSRRGQSSVSSPKSLVTPNPIFEEILAESERSPRTKMIAIANSYFDGIERGSAENVPFHKDCYRTENGVKTTSNPPRFAMDVATGLKYLFYITRIRNRRFLIVDEERGFVWGIFVFDISGNIKKIDIPGAPVELNRPQVLNARSILMAEVFKIVNGLIREIEALMVNVPFGSPSGWPDLD